MWKGEDPVQGMEETKVKNIIMCRCRYRHTHTHIHTQADIQLGAHIGAYEHTQTHTDTGMHKHIKTQKRRNINNEGHE